MESKRATNPSMAPPSRKLTMGRATMGAIPVRTATTSSNATVTFGASAGAGSMSTMFRRGKTIQRKRMIPSAPQQQGVPMPTNAQAMKGM